MLIIEFFCLLTEALGPNLYSEIAGFVSIPSIYKRKKIIKNDAVFPVTT